MNGQHSNTMNQNNFRNPPIFDPKINTYEFWKNELEVWKLVTDLKPEKQALAVSLSLQGNARDTAMAIEAKTLATAEGMDLLIQRLDSVFLKDDKDRSYEAYKSFDNYHRTEDVSTLQTYLVD